MLSALILNKVYILNIPSPAVNILFKLCKKLTMRFQYYGQNAMARNIVGLLPQIKTL